MTIISRIIALSAALICALAATASARNFSMSSQTWRAQFREMRLSMPEGTTNCQITLEGSLHARTMGKIIGSLVGYVTRANLGPCALGRATILTETLPWSFRYLGFVGTLPSISSLGFNIFGFAVKLTNGFFTCLRRSEPAEPVTLTSFRNTATGALDSATIGGTIRTGSECLEVRGSITSDRGVIGVLNAISTKITVTLI